ncbi:Acyl-CoA dehydrogenase [Arachidicoccus rhizosphaerae]|uniref:Acyl-CoA dehydrogenase n=1 Tax=Arachidicoccus rhizosphaerae TaxID=551991 RepID=A0A1H3XWH9_9BACT|nr:hypothetical protein [Arachidicoccus rhizosphaerae]SEA02954.1 Acyl-CoA dehydrogenase [Arachidicoccus rhizosphaerae]
MKEPSVANHPGMHLKKEWITLLREQAPEAEKLGRLTGRQLRLFYEEGWFKALVPRKYGGLEWSLSTVVAFEEAIGWAEGSAGWVFTLCSGAGWFGGYLDPVVAKRIFSPKKACLAGSGAVGGVAEELQNGQWQIRGQWQYATGAPHASYYTANVFLPAENKVRAIMLPPRAVNIQQTWKTIGLIASASESFQVACHEQSGLYFFDIDPDHPVVKASLYRLPFGALAEATIAANFSGMALHYMEEVAGLWAARKDVIHPFSGLVSKQPGWMGAAQKVYKMHWRQWQQARAQLFRAVEKLENYVNTHMTVPELSGDKKYLQRSMEVSKAAQHLSAACRQAVNNLYPYTGLTGAAMDSAIGKIWRDFQTGSQHALFVPGQ